MKKLTLSSTAIFDPQTATSVRQRGNRESRVPEIIDVSINVLIEMGYAGYTINRVANDAGIRLSTLQHYFSTREALLRATTEEIAKRYFERFRKFVENRNRSPQARLESIIDDAFADFVKPGLSAGIVESWGLALHESFARDVVVEAQKRFTRLFAQLVGEINPELSMEERELRGALIVSSCQGLVIFLRWSEDEASRMHAFRRAVKVVWSGLGKADE
ncbi:TetR/AcrR family transcriptional regulator [Paraburkholderia panacisoli]|uniref:TetR/AcrR family transcriptional regulator n=1 Tax=Paraburkholderia panacisoli TaxID=2603818 RepID=A0A5B0G943_9BURK|nr:TetR/AcrR family transcriptional regulator [Paraburkholderia panacisoli]KAA0998499.1 TetR/AcrR family transcriptional regulator [Paraburkholderia panacisoli]